jgi:hypothetical protein
MFLVSRPRACWPGVRPVAASRHDGRSVARGGAARQGRLKGGEMRPRTRASGPAERRDSPAGWTRSTADQAAGAAALAAARPPGAGARRRAPSPPPGSPRATAALTDEHFDREHPAQDRGPGPAARARPTRGRPSVGRRLRGDDSGSPAGTRGEEPVIGHQGPPRRRHEGGKPLTVPAARAGARRPVVQWTPEQIEELPAVP